MKKTIFTLISAVLLIATTAFLTASYCNKPKVKPDTILKAQFKAAEWDYYLNQIATQTNKLIKIDSVSVIAAYATIKSDKNLTDSICRNYNRKAADTIDMVLQTISANIKDQKINNIDFGK